MRTSVSWILAALLLAGAAPALAEPVDSAQSALRTVSGVNDLNDGWIHVVMPRNFVNVWGAVQAFTPDASGHLVVDVEVWYIGAVGQLPYRLEIGNTALFPHASLAFNDGSRDVFSTKGAYGTASADGKRMTYRIPYTMLEAAGAGGEPMTLWHSLQYVPRTDAALNSGGSPSRGDHPGADPDACVADPDDEPWTNCPASGGFFNNPKNWAFFRAFGGDPYAREGENAAGTPFGRGDGVAMVLGGSSSGPESELTPKGWFDKQEWGFSLMRVDG